MTAKRQLKERIRARMQKTGESYSQARRHILNQQSHECIIQGRMDQEGLQDAWVSLQPIVGSPDSTINQHLPGDPWGAPRTLYSCVVKADGSFQLKARRGTFRLYWCAKTFGLGARSIEIPKDTPNSLTLPLKSQPWGEARLTFVNQAGARLSNKNFIIVGRYARSKWDRIYRTVQSDQDGVATVAFFEGLIQWTAYQCDFNSCEQWKKDGHWHPGMKKHRSELQIMEVLRDQIVDKQVPIQFEAERGEILVSVVDSKGQGIAGAIVKIVEGESSHFDWFLFDLEEEQLNKVSGQRSNHEGHARFTGVERGSWRFIAKRQFDRGESSRVVIDEWGQKKTVTLVLDQKEKKGTLRLTFAPEVKLSALTVYKKESTSYQPLVPTQESEQSLLFPKVKAGPSEFIVVSEDPSQPYEEKILSLNTQQGKELTVPLSFKAATPLEGRLVDPQGQPIFAALNLQCFPTAHQVWAARRSLMTDKRGCFSMPFGTLGAEYAITIKQPGWPLYFFPLLTHNKSFQKLVLPKVIAELRVFFKNKPLKEVSIYGLKSELKTDSKGVARILEGEASQELSVKEEGYHEQYIPFEAGRLVYEFHLEKKTDPAQATRAPSQWFGQIQDEDGQALPGATISLQCRGLNRESITVTSNENGQFHCALSSHKAECQVNVYRADFQKYTTHWPIGDGVIQENMIITLVKGIPVQGRLEGQGQKPLHMTWIRIDNKEQRFQCKSDKEGHFDPGIVKPGRWLIELRPLLRLSKDRVQSIEIEVKKEQAEETLVIPFDIPENW